MLNKFLILFPLFLFCGAGHSNVREQDWLRVKIENKAEHRKEIHIRIKRQASFGSRWPIKASDWVVYRLAPKEIVEIICRKCSYKTRRFEMSFYRPEKKDWFDIVLTPNKLYWINLDSQQVWTLYSHKVDFTHYFN